MNRTSIVCTSLVAPALVIAAIALGPLNPPSGAVVSTNKTLAEVEPRIAINSTNTPGDTNSSFRITQPGSYYLTGNITGESGKYGIEISSTGVTIDLNGFELRGVPGSFDGISNVGFSIERTSVRNGTVREWGGSGIRLNSNSFSGSLESIIATQNGNTGIAVGNAYTVSRCSSYLNTGDGFSTPTTTSFLQCVSRNNSGSGFSVNIGCTLSHCSAVENAGNGFQSFFQGNAFSHCVASANTNGFMLASETHITNCNARANTADGIRATSGCVIIANNCAGNGAGTGGDGASIHVTGSDNRIEGNNCITSDRGIDIDAAGNIILKNTCSGNTTNWDIAAGNHYGPIIDRTAVAAPAAVNGNSATEALGSTHPNANFSY